MNNGANNEGDVGTAFAFLGLIPLIVLFLVWFISAAVAAIIAMERNRSPVLFGLCTFFFLGPIGVGIALLATRGELDQLPPSAKPKVAAGRRRFTCPRCLADNDIPDADSSYDCWRCNEHRNVKPKAAAQ